MRYKLIHKTVVRVDALSNKLTLDRLSENQSWNIAKLSFKHSLQIAHGRSPQR
ncbi:hypothetical protein DO73_1456 [Burkholderia pseudomallei]|nr:hypothetical protein DO73_1456 [Burkholderia pseudomallei]